MLQPSIDLDSQRTHIKQLVHAGRTVTEVLLALKNSSTIVARRTLERRLEAWRDEESPVALANDNEDNVE